MVAIAAIVPQQPRRPIVRRLQHVEVAVVVEVTIGGTPRYDGLIQRGPDAARDRLEPAAAEVSEEMGRFGVGDLRLEAVDVVGHVTVGGEDVHLSVQIRVEEEGRERQRQQRGLADGRRGRLVDEEAVPLIGV